MSDFADALEVARKGKIPVMALRLRRGELDDVVVETPKTFRAEMMSEKQLWFSCVFENGEHVTFWATASRGKLIFSVTETPEEYQDWDELRRKDR